MELYIYDIKSKEILFKSDKELPRVPINGDYISLASLTIDMSDYLKYKDDSPCEVVTVILYQGFADIYVNTESKFD